MDAPRSREGSDRLSIGAFSAATLLTVRALRHYDEAGLLTPVDVDGRTGYRSYAPGQVAVAVRIRELRHVGLPLEVIRAVLSEPGTAAAALTAHRERLVAQLTVTSDAIAALDHLLANEAKTKEPPMAYDITVRDLQPEAVALFRGRGAHTALFAEPVGPRFAALAMHILADGAEPVLGIGIANVHGEDLIDLELGFTTTALVTPADPWTTRLVDGGRFACTTFRGWTSKPDSYAALYE